MSSGTRTAMLADIRSNLRKSEPFEKIYPHLQPSHETPAAPEPISSDDLADRFCRELEAVGGEVYRASEDNAVETIESAVAAIGAKRIAISDIDGFDRLSDMELIKDPSRDDLFSVDAGITSAQLAIAETGTLVLRSAKEKNRLVSLVPPIHICVLNSKNIRPSMLEVLEEMSNQIDPTITFITGPSRTSDIELTLAIGVHGPKRLIVILID